MKKKGVNHKTLLFFCALFQYTVLFSNKPPPEVALSLNLSRQQHNNSFRSGIRARKAPLTYFRQTDLSTLSATQLKEYFEQYNYSEKDIFANPCCLMSDEFVCYAKTLPGYKEQIIKLYEEIRIKTGLGKFFGWIGGSYRWTLQGRIRNLYGEVQWWTDKPIQKQPTLQLKNIKSDIIDFAQSYDITKQQLTHKFTDQSQYKNHSKFLNYLSQASELETMYKQAPDFYFFLDAVGYGAANGIDANIHHEKNTASKWSTFCHEALEIAKGIAEGIKDGFVNTSMFFVNFVQDPKGSTQSFLQGIGNLLVLSGQVAGIKLKIDMLTITGDYPGLLRYTQELKEQCALVLDVCATRLAAMPNRDVARSTTAFAVEFYLVGKAFNLGFKLCSQLKPLLNSAIESLKTEPVVEYVVATAEGNIMHFREKASQVGSAAKNVAGKIADSVNQTSKAILKDGYYEVNGFKFTEFYYNKLWKSGRGAPSLPAKAILDNATKVIPDPAGYSGFFKYFADGWEMIYNPTKKIVCHIQPIMKKRT